MTQQSEVMVRRRKKGMHYANLFGLNRAERLEFAEMILHRDIQSWNDLTEAEWIRILDAFEGAHLIMHLQTLR